MKKVFIAAVIGALCSAGVQAEQAMDNTATARGMVKKFGGSLKGELQGAMKSGGPVKAIQVCNSKAPGIARDMSHSEGWDIGRTSLKLRNPMNQPDAWELKVLNDFEARKTAGEDPAKMEYSEVVEINGEKSFRYMKAIPTDKVCLNCHGAELKPAVSKELNMLYTEDKARGFKAGDIRGAFTLSKRL
jgi:hypothetical protein